MSVENIGNVKQKAFWQVIKMAKNVDMVNGKMFPSLMKFAIPVIIANVLQAFYSIVSHIVVGRYESSVALGAVGSATPVVSVIMTIFWGMSLGTNVLAANAVGAGDQNVLKLLRIRVF